LEYLVAPFLLAVVVWRSGLLVTIILLVVFHILLIGISVVCARIPKRLWGLLVPLVLAVVCTQQARDLIGLMLERIGHMH
jgi:hypothetical protein